MSQFWYTTETAKTLAEEALSIGGTADEITGIKRIAFVSCPSAFKAALDLGMLLTLLSLCSLCYKKPM